MSPQELKLRRDRGDAPLILDVRESEEYRIVNLGGVLIPLGELTARYQELDPEKEIVVLCHHGIRSAQATGFLRSVGFTKAQNLDGGIDRWTNQIDPSLPRY